jgi:hypothetical protein
MWKMMLHTYLPKDAASEQIKGLETGSWVAKHGKSASWQNLIDALGELIKLYSARKFVAARRQWNGAVGKAQQQLPVHVVNQYCHPTRSFFPCPNFATEDTLPRNRKSDNGDWFVCSYNGGSIGNNCFAYYRGSQRGGKCGEGGEGGPISRILYSGYTFDLPALFTYLNHQTQLHNQLLSDLSSKSYSLKP